MWRPWWICTPSRCLTANAAVSIHHAGVKQVMVRRFEPTGVQLIQEHHATDMSLVPTMANAPPNAPDLNDYNLSSMRNITPGRRGVVA